MALEVHVLAAQDRERRPWNLVEAMVHKIGRHCMKSLKTHIVPTFHTCASRLSALLKQGLLLGDSHEDGVSHVPCLRDCLRFSPKSQDSYGNDASQNLSLLTVCAFEAELAKSDDSREDEASLVSALFWTAAVNLNVKSDDGYEDHSIVHHVHVCHPRCLACTSTQPSAFAILNNF